MRWLLIIGALALTAATPPPRRAQPPIIDMHLHADPVDSQGPPPLAMCTPLAAMPVWDQRTPYPPQFMAMFKQPACADPIWSPVTEEALRARTLAQMERLNIVGVLSAAPDRVAAWKKAAPGRFLSGLGFSLHDGIAVDTVASLHRDGRLDVLAEVGTQYEGVAPTDPRLEPYWALAERLDIPVGIHVGPGPPGVIYLGADGYRARMHSALTMEDVLVRHPKLRVYLMHAGFPLIDDLLALLYAHPQIYVDTGVIVYTQPRRVFWTFLRRITDAGYGKRVMFGSDQMVWPEAIGRSVAVIQQDPWLTAAQKRDILYNNAARFLRLTPAQMAAHRQMGLR